MNCRQFRKLVDAEPWADRRVSAIQEAERHVEECACCKQYLDAAVELERGLSGLPPAVPSGGFAEGVMRRVRRSVGRPQARPAESRTETIALAAASIALVALGAAWLYYYRPRFPLETLAALPGAVRTAAAAMLDRVQPDAWWAGILALPEDAAMAVAAMLQYFDPVRWLAMLEDSASGVQADLVRWNIGRPPDLLTWCAAAGTLLLAVAVWLYDRRSAPAHPSHMSAPPDIDRGFP